MSLEKKPKLPHFVKALIDFIYGLLIFTCVAIALLMVASPFLIKGEGVVITASVPVMIGSGEEPRFEVAIADSQTKGIRSAFVDEAQGILRLETNNLTYIYTSLIAKLIIALGLAYIFYFLREILKDILQGDPFSPENSLRIRRMGYLILVMAFLTPLLDFVVANEIMRGMRIHPTLNLPSPFKAESILTGLLILILAQVWSYGFELKRDQALTI